MLSILQATETHADLAKCKLEVPTSAGHLWEGIPHIKLVTTIENIFKEEGFYSSKFRAHLHRNGGDLTASWTFDNYPGWMRGLASGFGLTTSNARRRALQFYTGVMSTTSNTTLINKSFPGWKYIKGINLEDKCRDAVMIWKMGSCEAVTRFLEFSTTPVTNAEAATLILTAARQKIIPWNRVSVADWIWTKNKIMTAWGIMVAFKESVDRMPAQDQMGSLLLFTDLILRRIIEPKRNST